jgi:hypothetical protein
MLRFRPIHRAICLLMPLLFVRLADAQAPSSYDYWPNPLSHTNSDAWLREHHREIALLKPRVLVLVADNQADMGKVRLFLGEAIRAAAEGSRYHGYSDPSSKPQLQYEIVSITDLRDKAGRWPAIWPVHVVDGKPKFDYNGLFSAEIAQAIGVHDKTDPKRFLNVRELFEHGLINEVWMVYPEIDGQPQNGIAGIFETAARVQKYDTQGNPLAHRFERCAGNGCLEATTDGQAHVTMRFAELNISLGVGCFTHATGHGFDTGLWRAIPEFDEASARFFNRKLQAQGLPMDSLYEGCPSKSDECWVYPNSHTIAKGSQAEDVPAFRDEHWGAGCGSVHFPPNGRSSHDFEDDRKVLSSCENYGLGNGPDGADKEQPYWFHGKTADASQPYDCGGAWQLYMRQSFPGYGSQAKNADKTPMKSWWPYLYY